MFTLACGETMSLRKSIYEPLHQRLLSAWTNRSADLLRNGRDTQENASGIGTQIHGVVEQRKLHEGPAHPSMGVDECGIRAHASIKNYAVEFRRA
ncbi:hypothetical protein FXB41_40155 [Bradyrhizobium canariense]|uniref:hypothetical protein n=1 Tax=Bradyrhizobium canariense TaxID=255045 RepID=UPI001CA5A9C0|nr:hypothetical protein [Bradyrhizobium canariense]MBW5440738.1 hypothetical protein [Bradyrhizobium canariense]